jgi:hypothetical protein
MTFVFFLLTSNPHACLSLVPAKVFFEAKSLISPYYVASDPMNNVEGKPRNASIKSHLSVVATLLLAFASMTF